MMVSCLEWKGTDCVDAAEVERLILIDHSRPLTGGRIPQPGVLRTRLYWMGKVGNWERIRTARRRL